MAGVAEEVVSAAGVGGGSGDPGLGCGGAGVVAAVLGCAEGVVERCAGGDGVAEVEVGCGEGEGGVLVAAGVGGGGEVLEGEVEVAVEG